MKQQADVGDFNATITGLEVIGCMFLWLNYSRNFITFALINVRY
jgi:hypothetical protein